MGRFLDLALLLFSFQATTAWAQAEPDIGGEQIEDFTKSAALAVSASASFPDAEIFGIKVVNGKPTRVTITVVNEEPESIVVNFVGGSLWTNDFDPSTARIVRNLSTHRYSQEVPGGEKQNILFSFDTNMHPQELRLNLATVISKDDTFYTVQAYNGTVSVVEPDSSIFDPQIIFLYIFLLASTIGVGYFFYNVWIAPYFPQKKKSGTKRAPIKKVDTSDIDSSSPAVATGSYNADWIPAGHLQRPEAKRVKSSGRPKSRQGKE